MLNLDFFGIILADSNDLVVIPMTLLFNPSTTRMPFEIQIPDNSLSEMQKQFNISLDRIETTSGVGALVTSGEPITIIVYDNDRKYNLISVTIFTYYN